ncbi:MAG: hypothetical protein WBP43_08975 [Chitinophagales bacterium]
MLKRVVILFLLCVGCLKYVGAQQIFISDPQKISTELIGYNILGKNKNGDVLVYKKYRFKDEIDVYDKQMSFKRRKEITIKNIDYETVEVYKSGDHIFHFYSYKDNKMLYLAVQHYNSDLEKKGDLVIVDSTSQKLGDNFTEFKIAKANTTPYYLIYKYELSAGRIDKLFLSVMNVESQIQQKNDINLPDDGYSPVLISEMITDEGQPIFLFENDEFNCKKDKTANQYTFIFPKNGNTWVSANINGGDYCLDEMNYALDVMNNRITAISFLKEDSKDYMVGYKYMTIDINSAGIGINFNYLFPPETLDEIAGLTKEKSIKNLPVYQISTIIPRVDGGALMVAEYYDKTVENYEYTNYDPYYGYRTSSRQVEFYEYDDILLFSIQADGSPSWNNVIRKKQLSREDRGVNSSYAIIKGKERLIFIFNEDIEQNSNVLQYEVTADGTLDRKSLFNANQQEVQIRPLSAEQISSTEIIIPSIYKKNLAFVKLQIQN